ncbi:hypothetical protein FRB95_008142 [Tulasnella sp. JGI-2019a]|nr:hypothetical protein FRB95_008142 [Tulasnella sp. JGI-2019a]
MVEPLGATSSNTILDHPLNIDTLSVTAAPEPQESLTSDPVYPDSIETYLAFRAQDPDRTFASDLPPSDWLPILLSAQQPQYPKAIRQTVLRDLIDCASRRPEKYEDLIFSILELANPAQGGASIEDPWMINIDDQETLNLFHSLPPSAVFPGKHTGASVTRIFEAMLRDDDLTFSIHIPFLQAAYPLLISPPPKRSSDSKAVPEGLRQRALWALMRFMGRIMLSLSNSQGDTSQSKKNMLTVVHIFSALASANCVPRSIMTLTFQGLGVIAKAPTFPAVDVDALRVTILQALVLTCLKWGWTSRALDLMMPMLGDSGVAWEDEWQPGREEEKRKGRAMQAPKVPPRSALSPALSNLVHQVALTLLVSPATKADFHAALALTTAYHNIYTYHPVKMPPALPVILQRLYATTSELFKDNEMAQGLVYHRLRKLSQDTKHNDAYHGPNRFVATRLLKFYIQSDDHTAALELIHSILNNDAHSQSQAPMSAASLSDMDPEFIAMVARAGYIGMAYELWRRADSHWKGYPRAHICGSRTLLEAAVGQCARGLNGSPHDVPFPVTKREFAERVLGAFKGLQLNGKQTLDLDDVQTFERCTEIFHGMSEDG